MPIVSIRIPQIGEGLQEARLLTVLKQPGDQVNRDEAIYQMETDKAVMDVESPYAGILTEWLAPPDSILSIGAEVARMEVAEADPAAEETVTVPSRGFEPDVAKSGSIPPRTRAYAKEKGVTEEQLQELAQKLGKVMPADVDDLVKASTATRFTQSAIPANQRVLNSRMMRAAQTVVPGTITVQVAWEAIDSERSKTKLTGSDFQPSAFTFFAFAVARAVQNHPALKTTLQGDEHYRTYNTLSLGIAVGLPGDELVLAVVEDADTLEWRSFAARTRDRIESARAGKDQANEAVTLSLTNMQSFGLRDAVPIVVPPAVATLFVGEIYKAVEEHEGGFRSHRVCNLALTFDHRVMNGVGAAQFLNAVKHNVEKISAILS